MPKNAKNRVFLVPGGSKSPPAGGSRGSPPFLTARSLGPGGSRAVSTPPGGAKNCHFWPKNAKKSLFFAKNHQFLLKFAKILRAPPAQIFGGSARINPPRPDIVKKMNPGRISFYLTTPEICQLFTKKNPAKGEGFLGDKKHGFWGVKNTFAKIRHYTFLGCRLTPKPTFLDPLFCQNRTPKNCQKMRFFCKKSRFFGKKWQKMPFFGKNRVRGGSPRVPPVSYGQIARSRRVPPELDPPGPPQKCDFLAKNRDFLRFFGIFCKKIDNFGPPQICQKIRIF